MTAGRGGRPQAPAAQANGAARADAEAADAAQAGDGEAGPAPARRRRYREPAQREAQILRESIRFFAENGFSGSTRDLARQIGITQPLLFRYFQSKDDLIERIYQVVFMDNWDSRWEATIADSSRPLRERLLDFYRSYLGKTFDADWMRLYVHAGLTNVGINHRYMEMVETRILRPLCVELRNQFCLVPVSLRPISDAEVAYMWNFHGGIFYRGVRQHAFRAPVKGDPDKVLEASIDAFLDAAPRVLAVLISQRVSLG